MTLSAEDAQLYYDLWLPLLDYVNKRYKVNRELKNIATAKELDPSKVKEVSDALCDNLSVIDDYLEQNRDIPKEHQSIIRSWKRSIKGQFFIERHLKSGSIFISMDDASVCRVGGLISGIDEMFAGIPMPTLVSATLMPFRDKNITDGLIMPYRVIIGGNMKREFKDIYMAAKCSGLIQEEM